MDNALVVLIPQRDEENHSFLVVAQSLIENRERWNLYNKDGILGDPDEHGTDDVECITVHDGHNWRSYTIDDRVAPFTDYMYLNDKDEADVLAQLKGASFGEYEKGISTAETAAYIFELSQWAGSLGVKVICKDVEPDPMEGQ